MSENKLTGSLGARNEINVDIIGTGARGKEGKSAYEIWLDLGNEGTEQEYLASLKGDDGYTPIKGIDYFDGEQGPMGTTNYNLLENRPSIQSIELIGNRTFEELGLSAMTRNEIENLI